MSSEDHVSQFGETDAETVEVVDIDEVLDQVDSRRPTVSIPQPGESGVDDPTAETEFNNTPPTNATAVTTSTTATTTAASNNSSSPDASGIDPEEEEDQYANATVAELLALAKGPASYRALLRRLVDEMPELPSCNVELKNLNAVVEVPVTKRDNSIPNVASSLAGMFKKLGTITQKKETRPIYRLHDVSVTFPAGTSTLILAPPGHGKTSMLQVIAGIISATSGQVLYNGKEAKDMEARVNRITGYVGQDDVHMPQLTVRETFMFAAENANVSAGLPDTEVVRKYTEERVELLLRVLGLTNCADTIVGNDVIRGVSGGEKRRVSIGEQLVTNARVILLDQYSTGLDASTTIDITRSLTAWAHITGGTVIATMLQPPPEVVEMYDNFVVLREGQVVYAGPRDQLRPYFGGAGFFCPPEMDTADLVTEIVTHPRTWVSKYEDQHHRTANNVLGASIAAIPLTTHRMHEHYNSKRGELMPKPAQPGATTIAGTKGVINDGSLTNDYAHTQYGKSHAKTFAEHFGFCVQRQFRLMRRNPQFLLAHIGQSIALALMLGSLFWQLDEDDFQLRVGLLLFVPSMLAFNNMAEVRTCVLTTFCDG